MDVSIWLRKQLEETSPDLLRAMVKEFAEALMSTGYPFRAFRPPPEEARV